MIFPSSADGKRTDIADDDVDPTEFGGCRLDPRLQSAGIGDVEPPPRRLDALRAQGFHRFRNIVGVTRADRDIGAFAGKEFGDRKPNALAPAGYEYALSLESEIHGRLRQKVAAGFFSRKPAA